MKGGGVSPAPSETPSLLSGAFFSSSHPWMTVKCHFMLTGSLLMSLQEHEGTSQRGTSIWKFELAFLGLKMDSCKAESLIFTSLFFLS